MPENDEELNDVKKQKVEEEKVKKRGIMSHFQTVDKNHRKTTKSMLKNIGITEKETHLTTPVNTTMMKTYLHLALYTPLGRDCIAGHKKVLEKLVKEMKEIDPDAVVTHYEGQFEKSN